MTATIHALIDGALYSDTRLRRLELVERMADDLVKWDAWRNEHDAFRSLIWSNRYPSSMEVSCCLDDARQLAAQIVVAKEMSES